MNTLRNAAEWAALLALGAGLGLLCAVLKVPAGAMLAAIGLVAFGVLAWLASAVWSLRGHGGPREPVLTTTLDAEGVRRTRPDGTVAESVRWDALTKVAVLTTSGGPYTDDFLWVLLAGPEQPENARGVVVPGTDAAARELLARLQRLPMFDHEAVVRAVGSTADAPFPCWSGASGTGVVCAAPEPAAQKDQPRPR